MQKWIVWFLVIHLANFLGSILLQLTRLCFAVHILCFLLFVFSFCSSLFHFFAFVGLILIWQCSADKHHMKDKASVYFMSLLIIFYVIHFLFWAVQVQTRAIMNLLVTALMAVESEEGLEQLTFDIILNFYLQKFPLHLVLSYNNK